MIIKLVQETPADKKTKEDAYSKSVHNFNPYARNGLILARLTQYPPGLNKRQMAIDVLKNIGILSQIEVAIVDDYLEFRMTYAGVVLFINMCLKKFIPNIINAVIEMGHYMELQTHLRYKFFENTKERYDKIKMEEKFVNDVNKNFEDETEFSNHISDYFVATNAALSDESMWLTDMGKKFANNLEKRVVMRRASINKATNPTIE